MAIDRATVEGIFQKAIAQLPEQRHRESARKNLIYVRLVSGQE